MAFWLLVPYLAAALVLAPVGIIMSSLFAPASDIWQHLVETTLPLLLINTFWLAIGVILGTSLLGTSLAWFTAVYEFPGRRFFFLGFVIANGHPGICNRICCVGVVRFYRPDSE